jgi:hypothetical protein
MSPNQFLLIPLSFIYIGKTNRQPRRSMSILKRKIRMRVKSCILLAEATIPPKIENNPPSKKGLRQNRDLRLRKIWRSEDPV